MSSRILSDGDVGEVDGIVSRIRSNASGTTTDLSLVVTTTSITSGTVGFTTRRMNHKNFSQCNSTTITC